MWRITPKGEHRTSPPEVVNIAIVPGHRSYVEVDGNARLIASAPELLHELSSRACGGCGKVMGNQENPGCPQCESARAIIRKAAGGKQ
jgi:hypothetical protein